MDMLRQQGETNEEGEKTMDKPRPPQDSKTTTLRHPLTKILTLLYPERSPAIPGPARPPPRWLEPSPEHGTGDADGGQRDADGTLSHQRRKYFGQQTSGERMKWGDSADSGMR